MRRHVRYICFVSVYLLCRTAVYILCTWIFTWQAQPDTAMLPVPVPVPVPVYLWECSDSMGVVRTETE